MYANIAKHNGTTYHLVLLSMLYRRISGNKIFILFSIPNICCAIANRAFSNIPYTIYYTLMYKIEIVALNFEHKFEFNK